LHRSKIEENAIMDTRAYGATGIRVSALGLGAGRVGDDALTEADAAALLNAALDAGITLIDTARGYGKSEARIGRHIAHRREEFVLSTKVGYGVEGQEDWTPECIRLGVDRALEVMRTEVLDIVHLHSCPARVLEESGVVEALLDTQRAGKVRAIAYSGENDDLAYAIDEGVFDGLMASVNICDQRILDDALPAIAQQRFGFIAKRPAANAPWRFADRPTGQYVEPYWDRFRAMGFGSSRNGSDAPGGRGWLEAALRFSAHAPGVSSCIVGTGSIDHLRECIAAVARGPLPDAEFRALREAFRCHDAGWVGQV
jgi:aryl-alcohol dehydrogenase-like predicted oxidoreductase